MSPSFSKRVKSITSTCAIRRTWSSCGRSFNPGPGPAHQLSLAAPLSYTPLPYDCLWACGVSSPVDTAQRPFRVVRMARNADQSVHIPGHCP